MSDLHRRETLIGLIDAALLAEQQSTWRAAAEVVRTWAEDDKTVQPSYAVLAQYLALYAEHA